MQVNGKLRDTIVVPRGLDRDEVMELALTLPKVAALIGDGPPRKVIVVPDRLVNIVA